MKSMRRVRRTRAATARRDIGRRVEDGALVASSRRDSAERAARRGEPSVSLDHGQRGGERRRIW